jgi:transposase
VNLMAISEAEKKVFERVIAEVGNDPEKAGVTIKVLFNFIQKTTPVTIELQNEVRRILEKYPYQGKHEALQKDLQKLGAILVNVAQEEEIGHTYSTGQLAKFFGVSITTVNNWIAAGRFIGVERSKKNKHARISEHTLWVSPTEEKIPVREIVETYKRNEIASVQESNKSHENLERMRYIVDSIDFFENRYGKPYEEVVKEKGNPENSTDWIWAREGKEWKYLLEEIGNAGGRLKGEEF